MRCQQYHRHTHHIYHPQKEQACCRQQQFIFPGKARGEAVSHPKAIHPIPYTTVPDDNSSSVLYPRGIIQKCQHFISYFLCR